MKKQLLVISLLCVAAATACKPVDDKMSSTSGTVPANTTSQPKSMSADSTQSGRVYAYEQKGEFVSSMKSQLAEMSRSVDELSMRIDKSTDSIKTEATPKISALRAQVATMTQQLDKVDDATASTWVAVRSGAESAHMALKDSLMQSRDWMTKKAVL